SFETTLNAAGLPSKGDYGDAVLKLAVDPNSIQSSQNTNGWGLKVADYFVPFNQATLNNTNTDLGSGGVLLLADGVGSTAHLHLLVVAGKGADIYLIDRDNMGHFDPNTDHVVQELPDATTASFDTPAYFNGSIYYVTPGDVAKAFSIANGTLSAAPTSQSGDSYGYPGATPTVSANGTSDGIVWTIDRGSGQLRAYDPGNLANELYTTAQAGNRRDQLG